MAAQSEVNKLQQHLKLLKDQYGKLQAKYADMEKRYYNLSATGNETSSEEDTFAARLLKTVAHLYNSPTFSDVAIKISPTRKVHGHRLVLASRSELFKEQSDEIDWTHMEEDVAEKLLYWIYTNEICFEDTAVTLRLIRVAFELKLANLVEQCEQVLIASCDVRSCVKFYSVAEEVEAENLREYCSALISAHWDDLNGSDFDHMSGPLLYKMLKSKTQLPLHAACRLQREDVVFLCLVENASKVSDVINLWSPNGDLPLDLAIRGKNESIAKTLIQHNADVNMRDDLGRSLLHRAILNEDSFSVLFLLENNCDATRTTRHDNETALHLLANSVEIEEAALIAEKLINRNAPLNAQNKHGLTALHLSIMADNAVIFNVLCAQSNLDANLCTSMHQHPPLYYAALKLEAGRALYAETLVHLQANVAYAYPETGDSLLQVLLREHKAQKACIFLLDHAPSHVGHCNNAGETCLHTACATPKGGGTEEFLQAALALISSPNAVNAATYNERKSAVHVATEHNYAAALKIFVDFNNNSSSNNGAATKNKEKAMIDFNARDSEGETALSLALARNFKDLVPILIGGGADVNVRNGKDLTLLHQAIVNEDVHTALFLLDHGADINALTSDSESPLQLAIHCRMPEVVDSLCTRGVDMSSPDRLGHCPLWSALDSGQDNVASILVRHGADTDCWHEAAEGFRQTLLHKAIDENKEAAAIFLIQAGCDLDTPRMEGPQGAGSDVAKEKAAPLHMCAEWGLQTVAQTLVEHRANVNSREYRLKTPLHVAIENQQAEIISLLLSVPEIDLSLRDKAGLSPFAAALTVRNNKAAQAILDKLPTAAEQFDSKGHNFLHTAIKRGDQESVLFLLSVQVDVNSRVQDATLTPPLHLAARCGNETLLRSLLLAGARVEDRNMQKQTAIHVASHAGNAQNVSALLQNNANFDAVDAAGDNALHVAVKEAHLNVVRVLLTESAIDAEAVNLKGRNPMHELCRNGKDNSAAICELFLECMPDYPVNKPDIDGNSPLLLAYTKGNGPLCRVLVKSGASLALENNDRVTIFNYQVATKQLLYKLLDQLGQPVPWGGSSTDMCQECGVPFSIMLRKHHCRHCSRVLCSKCSDQEVPIIKFGENKPVRVCKVCFDVLKSGIPQ